MVEANREDIEPASTVILDTIPIFVTAFDVNKDEAVIVLPDREEKVSSITSIVEARIAGAVKVDAVRVVKTTY
ncbi:MAG: hypothetical protein EBT10_05370 [Methylocystaceae bacterium]|nr:hypothetical protein [Methylocystaceae bacterium]